MTALSSVEEKNCNRVRYQISVQRQSLTKTGVLNLSRPNDALPVLAIRSLKGIGTQPHLRVLDLTLSPITSLRELPSQPALQQILASGSAIKDYVGLSRHPHLKLISFEETPLANRDNFRLSCLVLVGPHLASINGVSVSNAERRIACTYPLIAKPLLDHDWKIEVPVPSSQRFKALAGQFRLKLSGVDSGFTTDEALKYLRPPPALAAVRGKPEPEKRSHAGQDIELMQRISGKLKGIGVYVRAEETEVIRALTKLSAIVKDLSTIATLPGTVEAQEPDAETDQEHAAGSGEEESGLGD
jgi:hypothetical protein